jgi:hypothetical protein
MLGTRTVEADAGESRGQIATTPMTSSRACRAVTRHASFVAAPTAARFLFSTNTLLKALDPRRYYLHNQHLCSSVSPTL